jgi:chemotaxis protein methyltransferase CheR
MVLTLQTISQRDLKRLSASVYDHCGINLHDGKQELVQARLTKLLRHHHFETISDYLDYVLANPDSDDFCELIDSLSTNLTSFFREDEHFTYLAKELLPAIAQRRRGGPPAMIRAWSAASSTGEEPYSIALIIADFLESQTSGMSARILATDISRRVLKTAIQGVYDRSRTAPVPANLRRFFSPSAKQSHAVEVASQIKDLVRFAHLNLMETWPFNGPFDFIFCRNVMIYFDKPTQQKLINRFFDILEPGGILFTGHSESLTGIAHRFRYVQPTIYQKA